VAGHRQHDCVESGSSDGPVMVRDTKDRSGGMRTVPAEAWRVFWHRSAEKLLRFPAPKCRIGQEFYINADQFSLHC
jgi:Domain of unknown function (DUF397)